MLGAACEYENSNPVTEKSISPIVITKTCGNCHKILTLFERTN